MNPEKCAKSKQGAFLEEAFFRKFRRIIIIIASFLAHSLLAYAAQTLRIPAVANGQGVTVRVDSSATLEPSPGLLRLEFVEDASSSLGPRLRRAAVAAILPVALASDVSPDRIKWRLSAEGPLDGTSATFPLALMLMADLENFTLPQDVTATGEVLPDGTLAPVSGVLLKMRAAVDSGYTRMLLPSVLRQNQEMIEGKNIAIASEAKRLGLQLIFVENLEDARLVLSDKIPVRLNSTLSQPAAVREVMRQESQKLVTEYRQLRSQILPRLRSSTDRASTRRLLQQSDREFLMARRSLSADAPYAAFHNLRTAVNSLGTLARLLETIDSTSLNETTTLQRAEQSAKAIQAIIPQIMLADSPQIAVLRNEQTILLLDHLGRLSRVQRLRDTAQSIGSNVPLEFLTPLLLYAADQAAAVAQDSRPFSSLEPLLRDDTQAPVIRDWSRTLALTQRNQFTTFRQEVSRFPGNARIGLAFDPRFSSLLDTMLLFPQLDQGNGPTQLPHILLLVSEISDTALLRLKHTLLDSTLSEDYQWQPLRRDILAALLRSSRTGALRGMARTSPTVKTALSLLIQRADRLSVSGKPEDLTEALRIYWRARILAGIFAV